MASQSQQQPEYVDIKALMQKVSVSVPTDQEFIVIHEDRASSVFHQWQDRIKSKSAWHTPAAFCVSLALPLFTASFHDLPWIKGDKLEGVVIAALVGCFGWLVWVIIRGVRTPSASVEDFIAHLKEGTKKYGASSK